MERKKYFVIQTFACMQGEPNTVRMVNPITVKKTTKNGFLVRMVNPIKNTSKRLKVNCLRTFWDILNCIFNYHPLYAR